MIDINELRRLAQAATPHVGHACKYQDHHWLREGHVDFENADLFVASERPQEDATFYAAANPTVILELLDRLEAAESARRDDYQNWMTALDRNAELLAKLEAAEKERDYAKAAAENITLKLDYLRSKLETAENAQNDWLRANAPGGWIDNLRIENDALRTNLDDHRALVFDLRKEVEKLRAKIEQMERQEPVWWQTRTRPTWNDGTWGPWRKCSEEYAQDIKKTPLLHDWLYEARALYALPGAKGEEK